MNGLALCAGIGGLDLGVRLAVPTYRTIAHVELDPYARQCLRGWVWDDLKTFDGRPFRGVVDLVTAGFPCQPFSVAGKQLAQEDERHLWPDVARVVREVAPQLVYLENVPGLLVRGMGDVLGDLADLGFDAEWGVFSAAGSGAPHLRRRVFILASSPERGGLRDIGERVSGRRQAGVCPQGNAQPGHDGSEEPLADANSWGLEVGRITEPRGLQSTRRGEPDGCSLLRELEHTEASHADRPGCSEQRRAGAVGEEHSAAELSRWWETEPDVGRVVTRAPARTHQLRLLGNSVVPQCAARAFTELWRRLM